MVRTASVFCFALTCILSVGTAGADSFAPRPGPAVLTLNSDRNSGKAADWKFDVLDSVNAIRTGVTVQKLAYDPFSRPTFAITLRGEDGHKLVFKLASPNYRPPLAVRTESWVGDTFLSQTAFAAPLKLNERLDVAIDWTKNGKVTLTAGNETQTLFVGGPVRSVAFSAEVGEVRFEPLQLGYVFRPSELPDHYVLK